MCLEYVYNSHMGGCKKVQRLESELRNVASFPDSKLTGSPLLIIMIIQRKSGPVVWVRLLAQHEC